MIDKKQWAHRVAPFLILLIFTLPLLAQPDDPVGRNRALGRLHQALYHLHAQAEQIGWTDATNQLAGDIYAQLGDIRRAVVYWERSNPTTASRLNVLAQGYLLLEDWAGAVDTLTDLLTIAPSDEWATWHLATILASSNNLRASQLLETLRTSASYGAQAQALFDILAVEASPPVHALQIGGLLGNWGDWQMAEIAFRQFAILAPESGLALAYIGLARYMNGKRADMWFLRALQTEPHNAGVYYLHGIYLRGMGEMQASLSALENAIILAPENPAYYAELGMTYSAINNTELAEYWLQFAVDLSGGDEAFRDILAGYYIQQQEAAFDFDALRALLNPPTTPSPEATPES